jgi:hypothetical protein
VPRYRVRDPWKATPELLERMRKLRAEGKSWQVVGELCGVTMKTAQRWLSDAQWAQEKRENSPFWRTHELGR